MPVFKASKIPKKAISSAELLTIFCYYFPQYTLAQAKEMPYVRIVRMLKVVRKERAKHMLDFARVIFASGNKSGMKDVLSYFKQIIEE